MSATPPPRIYPAGARALHWIVALCVFGLIPVGIVMTRLPEGPAQDNLFFFHESTGIFVLALMILRLVIKAAGRMPPPSAALTPFELGASRMAHSALYVLLLVTPVIGWLGVSAFGSDVDVFGLFHLPQLIAKDEALSDRIFVVHIACAILIGLVVTAHVLGAIVHGIRGDDVNSRMRPF